MAFTYHYQHRVTFAETDMAGIVHFSNFFRYMENAEDAFFRHLGLSIHMTIDGRVVSWPRVHAECDYHAPARFEDELDVRLSVRKKTRKTITYDFAFRVQDRAIADGALTVVCAAIDPETKQMAALAIPKLIDEKIDVAPPGYGVPAGREDRDTTEDT
jgi:acyl-CoA thioester hydrolase